MDEEKSLNGKTGKDFQITLTYIHVILDKQMYPGNTQLALQLRLMQKSS